MVQSKDPDPTTSHGYTQGQLSMRKTWKLTGNIFCSWSYKEGTTGRWIGGMETSYGYDPHFPFSDSQTARLSQPQKSSLRSEGSEAHRELSGIGFCTRKTTFRECVCENQKSLHSGDPEGCQRLLNSVWKDAWNLIFPESCNHRCRSGKMPESEPLAVLTEFLREAGGCWNSPGKWSYWQQLFLRSCSFTLAPVLGSTISESIV